MSIRLPPPARRVFQRGTLCYLAVRTSHGPHLTPVVFVVDGGRLWVTTARGSVKARAWRRGEDLAGMVADGDVAVTFRGRARAYDAFDPTSWPSAVLAGPRLVEAAARFTLKNARFFAGYAMDAGKVPLAWSPPGRVFAAVTPSEGRILAGQEDPAGWGAWPGRSGYRRTFEPLPRRRMLDLQAPADVRQSVGVMGTGALALDGKRGLTVLPVAWRRVPAEGCYEAVLPEALADLAGTGPEAPAALTLDHASRWRAAEMTGLLLQGTASLHHPEATTRGRRTVLDRLGGDQGAVLVRLRPERVVWWQGWNSGTVRGSSPNRPPRDRVGAVTRAGGGEDR